MHIASTTRGTHLGFPQTMGHSLQAGGLQHRLFHALRRIAAREMLRSGVHESPARKISARKTASMLQRYNIQSETDIRVDKCNGMFTIAQSSAAIHTRPMFTGSLTKHAY